MSELKIKSVGDCIEPGIYHSHSCFQRVHNFSFGEKLVSLVTPEIGAAPLNIVLTGYNFERLKTIEIRSGKIQMGANHFNFSPDQIYHSRLQVTGFRPSVFNSNLLVLKTFLIENAPAKSLAFLLDDRRRQAFQTPLEIAFCERICHGVNLLFAGEIEVGAEQLSGCGFGLTPSGDDFLAGALLGLQLGGLICGKDYQTLKSEIFQSVQSENIFSKNFLRLARDGRTFERFKLLVEKLLHGSTREIPEAADSVLAFGATSGADLTVGVVKMVEHILHPSKK